MLLQGHPLFAWAERETGGNIRTEKSLSADIEKRGFFFISRKGTGLIDGAGGFCTGPGYGNQLQDCIEYGEIVLRKGKGAVQAEYDPVLLGSQYGFAAAEEVGGIADGVTLPDEISRTAGDAPEAVPVGLRVDDPPYFPGRFPHGFRKKAVSLKQAGVAEKAEQVISESMYIPVEAESIPAVLDEDGRDSCGGGAVVGAV